MVSPGVDSGAGKGEARTAPTGTALASMTFGVRDGRTRLVRSQVNPPLLVQRALYLDDALPDLASVFVANPTAGILEGDQQTIEVDLGPGCKAHVCTQAATKLFSMPNGRAAQRVSLNLQEGAYLEYMPDAIIPFRGARFSQETLITLAPSAALVFCETICPGRVEMGESFAFDQFRSRLSVFAPDGAPLYREAFSLPRRKCHPLSIGVMGRLGAPSLGTLLILGRSLDLERLRSGIHQRVGQFQELGLDARAGVSVLPNDVGVGLKVLGEPVSAVANVMQVAWSEGRRQIKGVDLPSRRKY